MQSFNTFNPPNRLLLGPGPSPVNPSVLSAISRPTIGHLDPEYLRAMHELQEMLRLVFQTTNEMTLAISGTGSAGMEAAVVNVVDPGDDVLICVNGVFGGRLADVAGRSGGVVHKIEKPWGEVFTADDLEESLKKHRPAMVAIVMAETSTGAWQELESISELVHRHDALLLVDAVTALGGVPVKVDEWEIDVIYSGTQKCLSCPPGLAPVSFSEKAMRKITSRKTKVQSWYLDITMLANYWGSERAYHHTAPINMTYALHEALRLILEEGLESCFERHMTNHLALKNGLDAIGIQYSAQSGSQLPMLNAVRVPEGVEDAQVRKQLLDDFGIEIGGGLGEFNGKVWRIGLMGHGSRQANVLLFLSALERILSENNLDIQTGTSIAAASAVYSEQGTPVE